MIISTMRQHHRDALVYRILGIALGLIVLMSVTSVLSTVMTRRIVQGADVRAGEQPGS